METAVFEERQTLPARDWIAFVAAALTAIGIWFTLEVEWIRWLAIAVAIVEFLLLRAVLSMRTVLTPTQLRFGMPVITKKLLLAEIQVGAVVKIPKLAGIGVHYYSGRWYYNMHFGNGIEISAGKTTYVIGSKEIERLHSLLLSSAHRRPVS